MSKIKSSSIIHRLSIKLLVITGIKGKTPWRTGMNEIIKNYGNLIKTPIIDLGGSKQASYAKIINKTYTTVNIDKNEKPDIEADLENTPISQISENYYSTVLCFNTLEHIFKFQNLLKECYRILKPGGYLHLAVPFITAIHGHPNDYYRFTPEALAKHLSLIGFSEITTFRVSTGVFVRAFGSLSFLLPKIFAAFLLPLGGLLDNIVFKLNSKIASDHVSGIYVIAKHH